MNRDKYTLSLDEKKELTNIAIHEGFDKAFHRLIEIAIDTGYETENKNPYTEKVLNEYYNCDLNTLITKLSISISKIHSDEECYDDNYSEQIKDWKDTLPLPVLEALLQFNFYETFKDCQKLERVCNLDQLIKEATIAVLYAYKSTIEEEDATYFYYNFFYAIPIKEDGKIKFIKLLYALDESYNDY